MSRSDLLMVEATEEGTTATTVTLVGELDMASAPAVTECIEKIHADRELIVDLRGLTFMDSMGLSTLIGVSQNGHRSCRFIRGPQTIHRVFEMTGMIDTFEWVDPAEVPGKE